MTEVAEKLSVACGKPIRYVTVSAEDAKRAQLAAGVPPFLADALGELFAERRKGKESKVSQVIPTVFGRRPMSFDEFATRHAAIFRGENRHHGSEPVGRTRRAAAFQRRHGTGSEDQEESRGRYDDADQR